MVVGETGLEQQLGFELIYAAGFHRLFSTYFKKEAIPEALILSLYWGLDICLCKIMFLMQNR